MKLSIIVPVYNEEKTVKKILTKVNKVKLPKGVEKEIVVVNDGSKDKTGQILKSIRGIKVFEHEKNLGKGAAVRTGFQKATGDIFLIQDADLEYNPEDYPKLLAPILSGNSSVVYGTRLVDYPLRLWGKNKTPMPIHFLANKLLTWATNFLYGEDLTDMETCYKVFKKKVLKKINLESNSFDIEPEITAKVLKAGYRIAEVPIKVKPRGYGEGKKIKWTDGIIAFWTLLKYRFVD